MFLSALLATGALAAGGICGADTMTPAVTAVDGVSPAASLRLSEIQDAAQLSNLDALEYLAAAIQAQPGDDDGYTACMKALCEALTVRRFGESAEIRRRLLLERCATDALATVPAMSLADQAYFMSRPMLSDETLTGAEWRTRRSARTRAWFALWAKLAATAFSEPPPAFSASSPMPPPTMDPVLSGQFTPELKRDHDERQDADGYHRQIVERYFRNAAEAFLAGAYSRPPFDIAELRTGLAAPYVPNDLRWRILGKVIYNMNQAGASADGLHE